MPHDFNTKTQREAADMLRSSADTVRDLARRVNDDPPTIADHITLLVSHLPVVQDHYPSVEVIWREVTRALAVLGDPTEKELDQWVLVVDDVDSDTISLRWERYDGRVQEPPK